VPTEEMLFEPELVVRGSTGPAPAGGLDARTAVITAGVE
jgi:hypothetical protein